MRISVLADCLRSIVNAERKGKKQVIPHSLSSIPNPLFPGLDQTFLQGCPQIPQNHAKARLDLLLSSCYLADLLRLHR